MVTLRTGADCGDTAAAQLLQALYIRLAGRRQLVKAMAGDAGTIEEMMLYTELQSAVHAMIQRLEYSFTFNPSLLTSPKRKKQVTEILAEAEKYIWRIKEEIRCA